MKTIRSIFLSVIFGISVLGFTPKAEAVDIDWDKCTWLLFGVPTTLFGISGFYHLVTLSSEEIKKRSNSTKESLFLVSSLATLIGFSLINKGAGIVK